MFLYEKFFIFNKELFGSIYLKIPYIYIWSYKSLVFSTSTDDVSSSKTYIYIYIFKYII